MSDGWSEEIEAAWIAEAKRGAEAIDRGELELVDSADMMARLRERAAAARARKLDMSRGGSLAEGSANADARASGPKVDGGERREYDLHVGLRATVRNGRLVTDEELQLPEGTVVEIVIDDEGDELDERERQALYAAISISLEQEARGDVKPVEEVLARLRERRP